MTVEWYEGLIFIVIAHDYEDIGCFELFVGGDDNIA